MADQLAMPAGVQRADNTPLQIETALEQGMRKVFSSKEIVNYLSSTPQMKNITQDSKTEKIAEETLETQKEILKEQQTEREKNRFKKTEKTSHERSSKSLNREQNEVVSSFKDTLIGPFAALAKPLKSLLGDKEGFGHSGKSKKKSTFMDVGVFDSGVKFSGEPTAENLKAVDPGSAGIMKLLQSEKDEKKKKNPLMDLLSGFKLPGLAGALSNMLGKAGGLGLIAAGLTWGIMDGIAGMTKSDEWGVSKISGFLGGFLGGTGSGWKGAFAGAGKWALIGTGIGMMLGPVGAIVGGLLGAAIGGIMGFIGGENIAKGLDSIWKWVKDTFDIDEIIRISPIGIIARFIDEQKKIWTNDKTSLPEKIGQVLGGLGKLVFDMAVWPINLVTELFQGKILKKGVDFEAVGKFIGKALGDFTTKTLPKFFYGVFDKLGDIGNVLKNFNSGNIVNMVSNVIGDMLKGIFEGLGLSGLWDSITKNPQLMGLVTGFKDGITQLFNFFGAIFGDTFKFLAKQGTNVLDLLTGKKDLGKFFMDFVGNIFVYLGNMANDFLQKNPIGRLIDQYLIRPIGNFFTGIGDWFSYMKSVTDKVLGGNIGAVGDFFNGEKSSQYSADKTAERNKAELAKQTSEYNAYVANPANKGNKFTADQLSAQGAIYNPNIVPVTNVRDAIITKSGQIIHTDPMDNLYAFKNIPDLGGAANSRVDGSLSKMDQSMSVTPKMMNDMIDKLAAALDKKGGNNALQQNNSYVDRFSSDNLLDSLTLEVS